VNPFSPWQGGALIPYNFPIFSSDQAKPTVWNGVYSNYLTDLSPSTHMKWPEGEKNEMLILPT
jgi:hypothetical protein